jgi:hypothetical protein
MSRSSDGPRDSNRSACSKKIALGGQSITETQSTYLPIEEKVMQYDCDSSLRRLLDTMDRRALLGKGAAMMGGLLSGLSMKPGRATLAGQAVPARKVHGHRLYQAGLGKRLHVGIR